MAFYRKYRPKTFDQMVGQEMIVKILKNAAIHNKISHAYLFTGPRGIGKTSIARILAKIVNCQKREEDKEFAKLGEPCNQCQNCQEIDKGKALDVLEIDAASNRGIDEVRSLKEIIKTSPSKMRKKVFIIDEAHQLTKEAFNALLKTLEEPPEQTMIILATTEYTKIPLTIASRTQQFHFKRISAQKIKKKLEEIVSQEKIKIHKPALEFIAYSAEGSIRDAESLLDQMACFSDKEITLVDIEKMIGKITISQISEFVDLLLCKNSRKIFENLEAIQNGGYDLVEFTKDLITYLRKVLVLKFEPSMKQSFVNEIPQEILEKMEKQSKIFKEKDIKIIKSLIEAFTYMRYSQFPLAALEVAIAENLK